MSAPTRVFGLAALLAALPLFACECTNRQYALPHRVESFAVNVKSVAVYGASGATTFTQWSQAAPMPMPRVGALLEVEVLARDEEGNFYAEYELPVSFRATPGHVVAVAEKAEVITAALTGSALPTLRSTNPRLLNMKGGVGRGYVLIEKVFGEAKLWAQDSPPQPVFALPSGEDDELPPDAGADLDAGPPPNLPDTGWVEVDGGRTFVAGLSEALWFDSPTMADTQLLPGKEVSFDNPWCPAKPSWNNRISPFIGNFLTIEAAPPRGDMIVTAISAEGFYATDRLARPISDTFYTDDPSGNRTLPGTYGHMYVYNYNYPDGLFTGDRVLALTGTVQEFSGATQMVFPSWIRKEGYPRPQDRPKAVLLDFSDPALTDACAAGDPLSHCDNGKAPTFYSLRCVQECGTGLCPAGTVCVDDQVCACQDSPKDSCAAAIPGSHCDVDSGKCVNVCPDVPCPEGEWCVQHHCVKPSDPCAGTTCPGGEKCNPATGACECGPSLGYRLSKTATFRGVPLAGTQWMDVLFAYSNNNNEVESLESSIVRVSNAIPAHQYVNCDANGNSNIPPFRWTSPQDAHGCFIQGAPSTWFCDPNGDDTVDCECNRDCITGQGAYAGDVCAESNNFRTYGQWVLQLEDKWKTRINVSTRDALPDFDPHVEFAKPEYKGCRVDVTGILRQVQAARPRWLILARDETDFCCRADVGAQCPTAENGGKCPKCPDAQQ